MSIEKARSELENFKKEMQTELAVTFNELSKDTPLQIALEIFNAKVSRMSRIDKTEEALLIEAVHELEKLFQRSGRKDLSLLYSVNPDILRIDQIELIINRYSEKIEAVKNDAHISDEQERQRKIDYWEEIRDREITALGIQSDE